jgi:acetylornithine deacetylase/succinyl-diaminopimelate desuccinylase-like protein
VRAEVRVVDGLVVLTTHGRAVHSSGADGGHNALWDLAAIAARLPIGDGPIAQMLRAVARDFDGDHHGRKLGLFHEDALMGPLLVAPTVLRTQDGAVTLQVNLRRPQGRTTEEFNASLTAAAKRLREASGGVVDEVTASRYVGEPHVAEVEGPLVQTLLDVYREHRRETGEVKPRSVRGGTYARLFPGAVDFGPHLPGEPYAGHAPDESFSLEALGFVARATADAMFRLAFDPAAPE